MVELVRCIVERLVDNSQAVEVTSRMEGEMEIVTVSVDADDTGKIIGKQGRIAMAIRTVVKAAAIKLGTKCSVEIIDKPEVQE